MTIIKVLNGILIHNGDYIFKMKRTTLFSLGRDNVPAYHVTIYKYGNGEKIEEMFFSDCSAKTAWHYFYHTARRNAWYGNSR